MGWLRREAAEVEVVVYTRATCGLCRRAEDLVSSEAKHATVRHVDVDSDPDLQARYNVRVPVIVVNGREVAEGLVQTGAVRAAVRDARRSRAREPGPSRSEEDA